LVRFSIRFLNGCDAGNYANISPLMDVLFGTYCCPDGEPESFGVQEAMPGGYLGQLAYPFRPRKQSSIALGAVDEAKLQIGRELALEPSPRPDGMAGAESFGDVVRIGRG
jgi:hypothetical protein